MDLGPRRESYIGTGKPKRRNSLGRVFILTLLILFGMYVVTRRQDWLQPFAPTPTPTRTASSYFDEAEVLYREGRLDEAIVAFRNAHQREPESWIALSRLVRLMVFRNQAAVAIEEYGEALWAFDTAETYAVLCLAYDWNGQYEEALDACVRAVGQNPDHADAHAYLSEVYSDLGKWNEAYDEALKALELNERSVEAHRVTVCWATMTWPSSSFKKLSKWIPTTQMPMISLAGHISRWGIAVGPWWKSSAHWKWILTLRQPMAI
jgi:tetratricopeptide (TPR) repeat protein